MNEIENPISFTPTFDTEPEKRIPHTCASVEVLLISFNDYVCESKFRKNLLAAVCLGLMIVIEILNNFDCGKALIDLRYIFSEKSKKA
ncbi:hypothetical protein [Kurthia zopfii]|uniref:hypothetical protein n=1 Tax=Kurthia zopfii TaxID=1650 RepID=UPI000F821931|nr:hypothetical protein [Kurthia zopfii]